MKKEKKQPDKTLLILVFLFLAWGILSIATISFPVSLEKFNDGYYLLKRQIFWGILPGLFLGFIAYKVSLNFLQKKALVLFLINLVVLILVFLPQFGASFSGGTRWISFQGISFQPSEFLKITSIIYVASLISKNLPYEGSSKGKKKGEQFRALFLGFLVVLGIISLILIKQPAISTLAIILGSLVLVYFSGRTPISHIIFLCLFFLVGLLFLLTSASYRADRFTVFLNPEVDPLGKGYQLNQSLIAIGSGGIFGQGIGMSRQKFGFLPQSFSDSAFSIIGEESGFLGTSFLIFLFLFFLYKGIIISRRTGEMFHQLMGLGVVFWITIQVFLNVGGLLNLLPLSGSSLPFISYGGSHLIAELIGVGLLLNISRHQRL